MDRTVVEMAPTTIQAYPLEPTIPATEESARYLGRKYYELSNHLGNVLTVITDEKRMVLNGSNYSHYESVVVSVTDYSPFGVSLTGRTFTTTEGYRYGFQNQETDKELWDGAVSYKYRIEDVRLGRFFSVDPLFRDFPNNGSFNFCENKVIANIDFEGREAWNATKLYDSMDAFRFGAYVKKGNVMNPLIKRTCEDLAIGLLMDYAYISGLPIKFKDSEGNVYSNRSNEFTSLHEFKFAIMEKFTANDLMGSGISKRIGNTQNEKERLRIKPGDILFSLNNGTRAEHVQIVTESGIVSQQMVDTWNSGGAQHLVDNFKVGDSYAKIVQGNFDGAPSHFTEGEHEPDDPDYIGSEIQQAFYNLSTDTYVRDFKNNKTATAGASKLFNQEIHEINFEEQNK